MFWKKSKKKDGKTGEPFAIAFDLDRRNYYRVEPRRDKPVFLQLAGKRLAALDVSAGGIAVRASGLKPGQRVQGILYLPIGGPIPVIMDVVKSIPGQMVAFEYSKIKPEDRERLHQYVLERQKEELEKQKKARLTPPKPGPPGTGEPT